MIDQTRPETRLARHAADSVRLPVSARLGRGLVLLGVFVCAACGLVYELALVALASYLVDDSVTQASVVLSVMVFAMGIGSLLVKWWPGSAAVGFALVEVLLALIGGLSMFALYGAFAWFGQCKSVLVFLALGIGVLIGAEIPLLMMLIQRIRRQDPGRAVADLTAVDYVGALAGGLAFPSLLLPRLGQLEATLATGMVNVLAGGGLVIWLFRSDLNHRSKLWLGAANGAVLTVLLTAVLFAEHFEAAARQAIHGSQVRRAEHTAVQEIVITGQGPGTLRLFLNGCLQVAAENEYRYHEALVHPAMAGSHGSVLILGGGDGLALREVLRYPGVQGVTLIDSDPGLLRLARTDPALSALNGWAYGDPRVTALAADPFNWLRTDATPGGYDVVIADLPEPYLSSSAKLYSREFYELVVRAMAPDGRLALYAGSPTDRPRVYWTVDATVRAAHLRAVEYQVGGASASLRQNLDHILCHGRGKAPDWGFILASRERPVLRLSREAPSLRSLTNDSLHTAGALADSRAWHTEEPSTLVHPRYSG